MQKINYQLEMEKVIKKEKGNLPTLLLHSCCAPCSSAVLERLAEHFQITVFYYNPNIGIPEEYEKRAAEQKRLIDEMPLTNPVHFIEGKYDPEHFYEMAKGMEQEQEGGLRCFSCYELRLEKAVRVAEELSMDYVTTTLTISPLKNAAKLNEIGLALTKDLQTKWLCSDFKKKGGYLRSIELSAQYGLYRQDYCGCVFSKKQREAEKIAKGLYRENISM